MKNAAQTRILAIALALATLAACVLAAMNFERDESIVPQNISAPALAWLKATGGDPTNVQFWTPSINKWAFGVDAPGCVPETCW